MIPHAFGIEAEAEAGIAIALARIEKELGMKAQRSPDVVVLRHGLLSVEDARRIYERVAGVAFSGSQRAIIIVASRVYHEAQNALLKTFEEPPPGTHLFLVIPSLGGLLPTLRSRVQVLSQGAKRIESNVPEVARAFVQAGKEERSALIKKLTSGKDDDKKRELRDETIALVNGIEAIAYEKRRRDDAVGALLRDIATLRPYLYDRSAPVKLILEHLSLVIPNDLV